MKTKFSEQFINFLTTAAQNMDPIAKWILGRLDLDHKDVFKGPANNFRLRRENGVDLVLYTPVDPNHSEIVKRIKLDPYYLFDKDQTCSLAKFLGLFKDMPKEFMANEAKENFALLLNFRQKCEVRVSDTKEAFVFAYDASNYHPGAQETSLGKSCMRHDSVVRTVADFYTEVGHAKILTVTSQETVVGRAVIWPKVTLGLKLDAVQTKFVQGSLLSRAYYTTPEVREIIFNAAKAAGINFRLQSQTYECNDVRCLTSLPLMHINAGEIFHVDVAEAEIFEPSAAYCGGAPYVDFFDEILETRGTIFLSRGENVGRFVGHVHNTNGSADITETDYQWLRKLQLPDEDGYESEEDITDRPERSIPHGWNAVPHSYFHGNNALETVHLPSSVTTIGSSAFQNCLNLREIALPSNLQRIGDYAFNGSGLRYIDIPDDVTEIGEGAFGECTSLCTVVMPSRLRVVPMQCFYCSNISVVHLPEGIEELGASSFAGCTAIERLDLPRTLKTIGYGVFWGCSSLAYLYIPESVEDIDVDAFNECPRLTIHGVAGSYAESFARENGIPFVAE